MKILPLKRVASIRVSNVDKKSVDGETPVRLCNYTDVYNRQTIRADQDFMAATATQDQLVSFRLLPSDVLITKDSETADDIGVPAYVATSAQDLICGYHLAILRTRPELMKGRFLYWCMMSDHMRSQLSLGATGVTRFGLRTDAIGSAAVTCPSKPQQHAIADFLDAETARIDALIAKKRRLIDCVRERSRAVCADLACGRKSGAVLSTSGHNWLGSIPSHWPVKPLRYIAQLESGHTPSRTRPELWSDCTIPWITLNDLAYLEKHEFVRQTTNLISEAGLAASSARVLPRDTVVLSRDATVGRSGILTEPMATSQHFVNWICSDSLLPRYLWLVITSAMQQHFESLTAGATIKTVGMPDVKSLVIPVPPLNEQREIVQLAEGVREHAVLQVSLIQRQLGLLLERRQALITAAVTGELEIPRAA